MAARIPGGAEACARAALARATSARTLGGDPVYLVYAKGERDLAAVAQVVFEDMPDHPGAGRRDWRPAWRASILSWAYGAREPLRRTDTKRAERRGDDAASRTVPVQRAFISAR